PNWAELRDHCIALIKRSWDLRVALNLARASLACDGLRGFADGLSVLQMLIERHWDTVHPRLDPDDNNDPMERTNIIAELTDRGATVDLLLDVTLVRSRKAGNFAYRDVLIAQGELTPIDPESSLPTMALVNAALQDCSLEELQETVEAVASCEEILVSIDRAVSDAVGQAQAPDLQPILSLIAAMRQLVAHAARERGGATGDVPSDMESGSSEDDDGQKIVSRGIQSRADAVRMMDQIRDYYLAHEPSSPIPLLMQRAKRLSSLNFLAIMEELAPGGLEQAQTITGSRDAGGEDNS
ncbi:MAG: type VI secretion system protein TssA, partial [Pseudomonadota bacterium]